MPGSEPHRLEELVLQVMLCVSFRKTLDLRNDGSLSGSDHPSKG
jgi:hypothetical protein